MNTNIQQTNIQYREITISQLPDCYFKEVLSNMVIDPNKASVFVVAKAGIIGDWASYIGWPALEEILPINRNRTEVEYYATTLRTPSQVESLGDKLDREVAEKLFPEWAYRKYRE